MNKSITKAVKNLKAALLAAESDRYAALADQLQAVLTRHGVPADDESLLRAQMEELRNLAEMATIGTERAVQQINNALAYARSLQTYDSAGRRTVTPVLQPPPQRF